jgi:hypothetical protein
MITFRADVATDVLPSRPGVGCHRLLIPGVVAFGRTQRKLAAVWHAG